MKRLIRWAANITGGKMNEEYIIVLIQAATTIIAALIGGLFSVLANRQSPSGLRNNEPLQQSKITKRSKWFWVAAGAIIGVLLSQSVWLFRNSISGLFSDTYFEKTLEISAVGDWQSSGTILEGQRVEVVARNEKWSPRVDSSKNRTWTDANGTGINSFFSEIGLNASSGSLIAKIGDGSPFVVGSNVEFVADTTGQLFFRINDINLDDNLGSITIRIRVWR